MRKGSPHIEIEILAKQSTKHDRRFRLKPTAIPSPAISQRAKTRCASDYVNLFDNKLNQLLQATQPRLYAESFKNCGSFRLKPPVRDSDPLPQIPTLYRTS